MHDRSNSSAPATWAEAFAALPMSEPIDNWPTIASRVGRRRTAFGWVALAATLVLALALPWKLQHDAAPSAPVSNPTGAPHGELEALYAQSAQLEALLAYARDDRVSSGTAATVSAQLDQRVASIDAALAQPHLTATRQRDLWRQRVDALRTLANFETNRRLLSAQGEHYDGALVRVD
jgi:hypothetical protein